MIQLFLTGLSLSMDAFAASVCEGLSDNKKGVSRALVVGLFFGGFQALMPALGYFLGTSFLEYIEAFDHWLAFGLLCLIGLNMIREAFKNEGDSCPLKPRSYAQLLVMAVATSIDALAVGITFAIDGADILKAAAVIGVTTFVLSFIGVAFGKKIGSKFEKGASVAGGIILVAIGTKILIEHLTA